MFSGIQFFKKMNSSISVDIIGKRNWYFFLSGLVIIPGVISLLLFGLRFSIDFTGGSLLEIAIQGAIKPVDKEQLKTVVEEQNIEVASVAPSGDNRFIFRLKPIDKNQSNTIQKSIAEKFGGKVQESRFETVGPIIGKELATKAILAVIVASIAIVLYIAWSFREVPKSAGGSWRFGIAAIVALLHDVFVVVGVFSLLGHFYGAEIDTLFITALLTVMGFSVHDSIVVFDRIRENLRRMPKSTFLQVVNESLVQTLGRSLSTSITVLITLFSLFLFSSGHLRWFLVTLLIGIISGTYSSIFNASPLLVVWQQWNDKRVKITRVPS